MPQPCVKDPSQQAPIPPLLSLPECPEVLLPAEVSRFVRLTFSFLLFPTDFSVILSMNTVTQHRRQGLDLKGSVLLVPGFFFIRWIPCYPAKSPSASGSVRMLGSTWSSLSLSYIQPSPNSSGPASKYFSSLGFVFLLSCALAQPSLSVVPTRASKSLHCTSSKIDQFTISPFSRSEVWKQCVSRVLCLLNPLLTDTGNETYIDKNPSTPMFNVVLLPVAKIQNHLS